jgi:hypothetical protein
MAFDEQQPIPLTREETEALTALCQSMGIPEAQAFHEVMRAGLSAYRMELALHLYHTTPQSTGAIGEHLGINRGDLLRELHTRGITPYEDPTIDRLALLDDLKQRQQQRQSE